MVHLSAKVSLFATATAFTSYNSPSTPGNWNFGGADLAKSLPEIQVRYQYPASFLGRGQAELESAMSNVAITDVPDDTGAEQMMLGLMHSPRPHRASFVQASDPLEILPPGVASGIAAKVADETPYTLVLHSPQESAAVTNGQVDSMARMEAQAEHSIEAAAAAQKQRMLDDELNKIHAMVANSRRASFMKSIYGGMVRKADYEIALHAPSESRADIDATVNSVLKVESGKAQSASAADAKLKAALLSAEIAKIGRIVRGHSSFLEPFVPPFAIQTASQASLPNVIEINYDVPKNGLSKELEALRSASFLKAHGDESPRRLPVLNVDIPVKA